jgi:hypothetical protein
MRVTALTKDPKRVGFAPSHYMGTAAAGAAGTITLQNSTDVTNAFTTDNHADIVGAVIVIVAGTGAFQAKNVSSYVAATRVATMAANWPTTPDNTSVYRIMHPTAAMQLLVDKAQFTGTGKNGGADRLARLLGEEVRESALIS